MTDRISITRWIVTMDNDMWFAPWNGDPGRTCIRNSAKIYRTERKAERAIGEAKQMYPGRNSSKWRPERIELVERDPGIPQEENTNA